jgi:5'-AMP-activated protein kinase catalytic alpha subunit
MFKDSFKTNSHFFILQELCKEGALFDRVIINKKMKESQAKKVFRQLMEALEYLQKNGISHRDIKTENIICNSNFEIKLIDFGFASKETGLLKTYCGSIQYCAPEILSCQPYDGMKSDLWSCRVVLFKMITGSLPFDKFSFSRTINLIKNCDFSIPQTVSKSASNLIQSLLVLNPEQRLSPKEVLKHEWLSLNHDEE